jgi:ATP-binding cassette, subfamily B, bacterial HlyB/CyaB
MNNRSQPSTISGNDIQAFLQTIAPFDQLSENDLRAYISKMKPLRFRMGQKILINTHLPQQVSIIFSGKVRLVGIEPSTGKPVSLKVLEAGALLGWIGLLREMPCETALASEETICFVLPAVEFTKLIQHQPSVTGVFEVPHRSEIFDIITHYFQQQSWAIPKDSDLFQLTREACQNAIVAQKLPDLMIDRLWFDSKADKTSLGKPLTATSKFSKPSRLIGIHTHLLTATLSAVEDSYYDDSAMTATALIDYAPELDFQVTSSDFSAPPTQLVVTNHGSKFPAVRGQGVRDGILACFQMLSMYLGIKYRRDTVQRIVDLQLSRNNQASLQLCAVIADVLGLMGRLMDIPANQIHRITNPAIIPWEDSYAVIYQVSEQQIVLGTPQAGVQKIRFQQFVQRLGDPRTPVQVLLLQETKNIQRQKFGLGWFMPYLLPEVKVLGEVLVASFFVQILGLANPLLVQVIIDRVLGQNSPSTLQIFGILLIGVAFFESILTSIRSIAFANATNRIDLALAAKIIDHLFQLLRPPRCRRTINENR